mgnify:CR=1 FL=1
MQPSFGIGLLLHSRHHLADPHLTSTEHVTRRASTHDCVNVQHGRCTISTIKVRQHMEQSQCCHGRQAHGQHWVFHVRLCPAYVIPSVPNTFVRLAQWVCHRCCDERDHGPQRIHLPGQVCVHLQFMETSRGSK